jgi:Holliday junction resolvasome RuvABC DNA-binding subunit
MIFLIHKLNYLENNTKQKNNMKQGTTKIAKAHLIMQGLIFLGYKPEQYSELLKLLGSQDNLLNFIESQLTK